ncbi:GOLPH3/VPS74 family protein [Nocardiopsis ansamitocini]|uniref:GPP34 family phosphoprotein n=1 Tax=Nocardiopsis ansamitocini TaxID=1670832 RepID=A0A9W6P9M8_9ACTN|nr:GPP34 family phosphoprotein [Nocardiopsis ansamitocini]GLU50185.1 hypothetical protein Nans01_45360 [Nocardiopsis ansamitocini]
MDLTLPQRLYLISYDTDKGRFDPVSTTYRGPLLRAAALAELIIGGLLHGRGGKAEHTAVRPPEDPFLAEVLADVAPNEPGHWINAVQRGTVRAEEAVCEQLVANGSITVERGRMLGVFPTRTVTPNDPGQVRLLREHTRNAVVAGHDPATVPIEDAALAVIAVEGDIWTVFGPQERGTHKAALKALQKRFDSEVPALRNAILTTVVNSRAGMRFA